MKTVKIIGVPEHFNYPWHMAIEEGAFDAYGIELVWEDIPEGTGRMCQMLQDKETDLAIILTEGILKSITEGNPSKIVQTYVETPLIWGIHVGINSKFKSLEDLKKGKVAISRYGSGSHLMAYINAKNKGWDTNNLQFEIVNNLSGAIEALTNGTADYFMWEHFTTKPLVENGTFRRIADCPTSWPCFVIAATQNFINEEEIILNQLLNIINNYTIEFKNIPSIDRTLSNKYGQKLEDIKEWLRLTRWSQQQISKATVDKVQNEMLGSGLIKTKFNDSKIIH